MDDTYQDRVVAWLTDCFGRDVASDKRDRTHRFLEEALELVQATGGSRDEVLLLVDYVYARQQGSVESEAGGVMVTLAGLCEAHGIDLAQAGERELARNRARTPEIRAKHARKPLGTPLPQ